MKWIYKRAIITVIALFVAITLTFYMVRVMPGNPAASLIIQYMQQGYSYTEAVQMASTAIGYNLSEPIWQAYISYIINLFHGNLGRSIDYDAPVSVIIANTLPITLFEVIVSLLVSFFLGVYLGLALAYLRKHKHFIATSKIILSILNGIPNYILALLLLYYFAVIYKIFPSSGAWGDVQIGLSLPFIVSFLRHMTLPLLSFILTMIPGWTFGMMGNAVSVIKDDYVNSAKARGIPNRRIMFTYVGRNSILPLYTGLILSFGFLLGGAVFIETIFHIPGFGYYMYQAIGGLDYPLMMGYFLVIMITIIGGNFLADLTYSLIDPRVKVGGEG